MNVSLSDFVGVTNGQAVALNRVPVLRLESLHAAVAAGVAAGLLFTLTHFWCKGKLALLITDILYCALVSYLLFTLNLYCNYGRAQLFVIFSFALGAFLYAKTSHSYLDKALLSLYNNFTKELREKSHAKGQKNDAHR